MGATGHSYHSHEIPYLTELLGHFGLDSAMRGEEALRLVERNHEMLEQFRTEIQRWIELEQERGKDAQEMFLALSQIVHQWLFKGILVNAGQFRDMSDSMNGQVFFGGDSPKTGEPKFKGTTSDKIEAELQVAFRHLNRPLQDTPEACAILFYAEFVAIHPFYDANGRVARLLVNFFLASYGKAVFWAALKQKEGKFLRKLNACHSTRFKMLEDEKRYAKGTWRAETKVQRMAYWNMIRKKYQQYLIQFWGLHIINVPNDG